MAGCPKGRVILRYAKIINETRRSVLAEEAEMADTFWRRAKGLMGRDHLSAGRGVVLIPCNSVHSMLMRFPIDVIHVARDGTVLKTITSLLPFRLGPIVRGSQCTIELPAGTISRTGTCVGDRIVVAPFKPYRNA